MPDQQLKNAMNGFRDGVRLRNCGDLDAAERCIRDALNVFETTAQENFIGMCFNELGQISQARGDLDQAEKMYRKAAARQKRASDWEDLGLTYHQLARIADLKGDPIGAEKWCLSSLNQKSRINDEKNKGATYQLLGKICEARNDLEAAHDWGVKALESAQRFDDALGGAFALNLLGAIAARCDQYVVAADMFFRMYGVFAAMGDQEKAESARDNLVICLRDCTADEKPGIQELCHRAGLET